MYRIALIFSFIWVTCFVWQTAKVKMDIGFLDDWATYTLALLVLFLVACLNPLAMFYRSTRIQILYTLGHILISPFGIVRFRHFFLADVITSITTPLQETMIIYCYFAGPDHNWKNSTKVDLPQECIGAQKFYTLFAFLPYWFRFAQCLRKRYDSGQNVHLINAGKYFSDLMVPLAQLHQLGYHSYDYNRAFWIWFTIHFIASFYSYCWDIYMDWGLLRSKKPEKYALRESINYSPWFYYYAMVSDFILRYTWCITIVQLGDPNSPFNNFKVMSFIMIMCECFRRAQWSLIRVENEQNNNLETYRTIPIIPPIVDDNQEGSVELPR